MALTGSGELKFSQMRDEFTGSGQVKFSDLYRGGSLVRANAGNNSSTNLAANVPTSGEIQISDFYSQARGFRKTFTEGATNQNASTIFGSDFGVDYPKEIVINAGVELGATNTSDEALQINSAGAGTITITNNGTISGAGGSANGGTGGDAFEATTACILINNGTIRAGGGGGGAGGSGGTGGTGGQGQTSTSGYGGWSGYSAFYDYNNFWGVSNGNSQCYVNTGGTRRWTQTHGDFATRTLSPRVNNIQYQRGSLWESPGSYYVRSRTYSTTYTYYNGGAGGSGGAGGAGGRGQGYNHGNQNGSGGSAGAGGSGGGTNAGAGGQGGTGGTGGNGGTYGNGGGNGNTGATGNTGANGNRSGSSGNGSGGSGGAGGSSGGAAGRYINGLSNVTFTNNGTVQGGTA